MSRDFELLRKVEQRSRSTARVPRREAYPESVRPTEITESHQVIGPAGQVGARESDWVKALAVVRKRWRLAAIFAATVLGVTALIAFWIKPEYQPSGRLEINPPGSETFTMQASGGSLSETQYLGTQAQNLETDDLAVAVIRKLRLDQSPDFNAKVPAAAPSKDPLRFTAAENAALRTFRARLKVLHDPNSHMIAVSVTAHEPQLAADVTNTLMQTFVDRTLKMRHDTIASSRAWLQDQLNDVRAKAEQSNRDLAAFQKQTGVAEIDEARNTFGDLMTDLNRQTTQIQSERIQLESYLQKAREGEVDSLPQVRENPVVQKLTQTLAEVRAQLSQDLVIYGINHPNTKKLQNQVVELEKQLSIQRKEALDQLRISYDAARARERLMAAQKKEASKTASDMAEYNILKKQAQAQASLYNTLLGRIEEAGIAAASQSSNIRIVDLARVLDRPTRPHRVRYLGFGLVVGLMGGIVLAFLREKVDRPLRTPQDVRDWTGIPSVSLIPEFASNGFHRGINRLKPAQDSAGPAKFLFERPHSPESEAVRALHANIVLAKEEQPQVVLVTSSLPGEGKTTVAVNLALALAQYQRTCLVDADLRRPCVAATFGVSSDSGLGDVLLGSVALQDALITMQDSPNLVILPGGKASDESAHLIASMVMKSVMESLRAQFDFIVLDSSPIIPYAEGRALSTLTDGIIFVTRSGITPGPAMARSMELLCELKSPRIVKVVLNAHNFPNQDYYYYPYKRS
ncbi:MAG TPA: polysaccharide biosynthesis tyrosine autokinase [Candidatus Polarisedimenticolia bacterium]|jgi:succinoglycan biosynthesis transport protein ExoP|nr:polysaccharide biosynthesis tyrosine autokinase [Candidatus Polarisedimenticolia bacterium]